MLTRTSSGYKSIKQHVEHAEPSVLESQDKLKTRSEMTPYLIYLVFIATLGPFQFGYHLGELNAPQKVITCQANQLPVASAQFPTYLPECIPMNASEWGLTQSIYSIGGLLGALIGGPASTRYGRRPSMQALALVLSLGAMIEAFAFSIGLLTTGRFVSGIGAGAATVICPIYICEISPVAKRGLLGAFTQVMVNTGILVAQSLAYFFSRDSLWRVILATPSIIAMVTFLGLLAAPESPKWLAENSQLQVARVVLQRIRGHDVDIMDEINSWTVEGDAEQEALLHPLPQIAQRKQSSASFKDVVSVPRYRKAVVAVVATMMAQQLTGINSVVMYSVTVLATILPSAAALITVMVSGMNVITTVVCAPLADKIGRKACLLISTGTMGVSSMILAIGLSNDLQTLTVIAIFTFVCGFAIGLGPIPFILTSELVGPEAVGATSSWALASNWISAFAVAQFFPMLSQALPHGQVYRVFVGTALLFGALIAWCLPETNGKANVEEVWK